MIYLFLAQGAHPAGQNKLLWILERATPEAKVIIGILMVFSIFAWTIMASKAMQMRRAKKLNFLFEGEFRTQKHVLDIFDRRVQVDDCPLFVVYQDGCKELDTRLKLPDGGRIMLAIAVSGAPFLGLLGTVWGVMDAFGGIAQSAAAGGRADLAAMAPGVSAAMVTTVAGLLVAIPSMFGYNWLVHNLRVLTVELDNFAQALVSKMETEYLED